MTNIPNLDTYQEKSWVAYYDVTEYTELEEINPEEINDELDMTTKMKGYDDGIVLEYDGPTREYYTVRASTNGFLTIHMDIAHDYTRSNQSSSSGIDGVHDIVYWNQSASIANNMIENVLERAIYNCLNSLSEWDSDISDNYNKEDVGLYNYEYDSKKSTVFSYSLDSPDSDTTKVFSFTDETNIHKIIIAAHGYQGDSIYAGVGLHIDNVEILDTYNENRSEFIAVDYTEEYDVGNPVELYLNTRRGSGSSISVHVVVIWE